MAIYVVLRTDKIRAKEDKSISQNTPIPIELIWKKGTQKFSYQFGEKVAVKNWNKEKGKVQGLRTETQSINDLIDFFKGRIKEAERNIRLQTLPLVTDNVKPEFLRLINEEAKEVRSDSFYTVLDQYYEDNKSLKAHNYIRFVNQLKLKLKDFKPKIRVSEITHSFVSDYVNFLVEEHNLTNSTIKSHVKFLRNILKYADRKAYEVSKDYLEFTYSSEDSKRLVFLDEQELKSISNTQYTTLELKRTADIYLFACHTGLRYSDLDQAKSENIKGGVLNYVMTKTRKKHSISLSQVCLDILKKYDGQLPLISNQKLNHYLKDVAKEAGLNSLVSQYRYSGSGRELINKLKYELLSMHTARHTFATLSLKRGMPINVLKDLLGHSSVSITENYLHLLEGEQHKEMKRVWK